MPNKVFLKNGAQAPKKIVEKTTGSLEILEQDYPGVFLELVSACGDPNHKINMIAEKKLTKMALMEQGIIHRSVKDIVISSVNLQDLKIEDPNA